MNNFKETALAITEFVVDLRSQNIDVTMSLDKRISSVKPIDQIIVYHWVEETFISKSNPLDRKIERDIAKSFYIYETKHIQPCLDYLKSLVTEEVCHS